MNNKVRLAKLHPFLYIMSFRILQDVNAHIFKAGVRWRTWHMKRFVKIRTQTHKEPQRVN